jgi:methionyl-tRNA formyltransferase
MRRVVLFGSGSPLSCLVAERLVERARLAAVIVPDMPWKTRVRWALGGRAPASALTRIATKGGASVGPLSTAAKYLPGADLIVIASFPRRIPAELISSAPALNVHMSLLPRHRGPDPVFAAYWHDDRETGVTVHYATGEIDAGAILAQQSVPLRRGLPSRDLYMSLAGQGADLLVRSIEAACATVRGTPQDEKKALAHTAADLSSATIPFGVWPAERVWHVLSGLGDQWSALVADASGSRVKHGRAHVYRPGPSEPGRIETIPSGWLLHASDGVVELLRR